MLIVSLREAIYQHQHVSLISYFYLITNKSQYVISYAKLNIIYTLKKKETFCVHLYIEIAT